MAEQLCFRYANCVFIPVTVAQKIGLTVPTSCTLYKPSYPPTKPAKPVKFYDEQRVQRRDAGPNARPRRYFVLPCYNPAVRRAINISTLFRPRQIDTRAIEWPNPPVPLWTHPYPDQTEPVRACEHQMRTDGGGATLCLPCGHGKTNCALEIARRLGRSPVVVLVGTKLLRTQWKQRIASVSGIAPEKIVTHVDDAIKAGNAVEWAVLLYQGVYARQQELIKSNTQAFGLLSAHLLILDEAHHAPALTVAQALKFVDVNYTLAITATPERSDNLTDSLYWMMGQVAYRRECLYEMPTTYVQLFTQGASAVSPGLLSSCYADYITALSQAEKRNNDIMRHIMGQVVTAQTRVIHLTARVEHAQWIYDNVGSDNDAKMLIADSSVVTNVGNSDAAQFAHVVGTVDMAGEALDIPYLNTLVLWTPLFVNRDTGDSRLIKQAVGRIMRKTQNKDAVCIVDVCDVTHDALVRRHKQRRNLIERICRPVTISDAAC